MIVIEGSSIIVITLTRSRFEPLHNPPATPKPTGGVVTVRLGIYETLGFH